MRQLRHAHDTYWIEDDGERLAVLRFALPLGWHWKTIRGDGTALRFRRALAQAVRACPSRAEAVEARERAAAQRISTPYAEPSGRAHTGPDCTSGLPSGKVSENV